MADNILRFSYKNHLGLSLFVYDDRVEIARNDTVMSALMQGSRGRKTYYYSDITSVELKHLRFSPGHIEITIPGGKDASAWDTSENRFMFGTGFWSREEKDKVNDYMTEVHSFIMQKVQAYKHGSSNFSSVSAADEILKFKSLLDQGIITEQEFEAKKSRF